MRNYRTSLLGLAIVGSLLQVTNATAGVVTNGDFESGSLAGWYSSGTTAMVSSTSGTAGYYPMGGNDSALVVAMSTAPVPPYSCFNDRWNVACPLPLPFAASGALPPTHTLGFGVPVGMSIFTRGGSIGQDVNVLSGETISWNWIPGGEASPNGNNDIARFFATNGSIEVMIQQNQNVHSFTFNSTGVWSIYFGLYQAQDSLEYSTLELDSIKISPVPEPSPVVLFSVAMFAFVMRRRFFA